MGRGILIVDDSPQLRQGVRSVFQAHGYLVCGEAGNGKEAIEMAELLQPELIVLDFSMPVMNGLDAARTLHEKMPSVPVILFSNYADALGGTTQLGISAIVSKDRAITALVSEAESLLKARRAN